MYSWKDLQESGPLSSVSGFLAPMEPATPVNFFFFDYSSRGWARLDTT
jgi:hypothetical protein